MWSGHSASHHLVPRPSWNKDLMWEGLLADIWWVGGSTLTFARVFNITVKLVTLLCISVQNAYTEVTHWNYQIKTVMLRTSNEGMIRMICPYLNILGWLSPVLHICVIVNHCIITNNGAGIRFQRYDCWLVGILLLIPVQFEETVLLINLYVTVTQEYLLTYFACILNKSDTHFLNEPC